MNSPFIHIGYEVVANQHCLIPFKICGADFLYMNSTSFEYVKDVIKAINDQLVLKQVSDVQGEQLSKHLEAFKSHVLQNEAEAMEGCRSSEFYNVENVRVVNGVMKWVGPSRKTQAGRYQPIYKNDIVIVSEYSEFNGIRSLIDSQCPFALLLVNSSQGENPLIIKCTAQLVARNQGLELLEVMDIIESHGGIHVIHNMTSFLRIYESLCQETIHSKSPLLGCLHKATTQKNSLKNASIKDKHYQGLNDIQTQAANHVMAMKDKPGIASIQGPPGTGKTYLLSVMLYHSLTQVKDAIVVCAPSNAGVCNVANKFIAMYGNDERILNDIAILGRDDKVVDGKLLSKKAMSRYFNEKAKNVKWRGKVRMIFCTVNCTRSARMLCQSFSKVFCDEAGQLSEAEAWMLILNEVSHLIMMGDHKQLPAMYHLKEAKALKSNRSLFERFWHLKIGYQVMLTTQYRMAPAIAKIVSTYSYDDQLLNDASVVNRSLGVKHPYGTLKLIDCKGNQLNGSKSYSNAKEVKRVIGVVNGIRNCTSQTSLPTIGIITGYVAQREAIREGINRPDVKIGTVDSFQGQEMDIIIVSLVRTKESIGFMRDKNRVNVLLSRARHSLIIVGDLVFYRKFKPWKTLLEQMETQPQKNHIESNTSMKKNQSVMPHQKKEPKQNLPSSSAINKAKVSKKKKTQSSVPVLEMTPLATPPKNPRSKKTKKTMQSNQSQVDITTPAKKKVKSIKSDKSHKSRKSHNKQVVVQVGVTELTEWLDQCVLKISQNEKPEVFNDISVTVLEKYVNHIKKQVMKAGMDSHDYVIQCTAYMCKMMKAEDIKGHILKLLQSHLHGRLNKSYKGIVTTYLKSRSK